jgi:hypothetical protein
MSAWFHVLRALLAVPLYAGLPVFLFDQRAGVLLMLAGMVGLFATHLAFAIVGYRRTMSHPWPKVPPLDEDDDEW